MKQTKMKFDDLKASDVIPTQDLLIIGGIYMYREDNFIDMYDGMFAICFGTDKFHFLFNGIEHIENECELATASKMKHLPVYVLAINYIHMKWFIKDPSRKNKPGYILQEGDYIAGFEQSLEPYLKIFHK